MKYLLLCAVLICIVACKKDDDDNRKVRVDCYKDQKLVRKFMTDTNTVFKSDDGCVYQTCLIIEVE